MVLGFFMLGGAAMAEVVSIGDVNGLKTFRWGGVTFEIPKEFFFGFRPYTHEDKEVWIQFGYMNSKATFVSPNEDGYDLLIDVHVRLIKTEDPKAALATIHRAGLPFEKVSAFGRAEFGGMTYLGSSSLGPYFRMNDQDVYVGCNLVIHGRVQFPNVGSNALNDRYFCNTAFALPGGLYAWMTLSRVHLSEVAKAIVDAQRKVHSFING